MYMERMQCGSVVDDTLTVRSAYAGAFHGICSGLKFAAMDVEADLVFVYREAPFFTGSTSIGLQSGGRSSTSGSGNTLFAVRYRHIRARGIRLWALHPPHANSNQGCALSKQVRLSSSSVRGPFRTQHHPA